MAKYWHVAEAVDALGAQSTTREIRAWLASRYPGEDHTDLRENLSLLTVNERNRPHYDKARKEWRTDLRHERDRLYRSGKNKSVTYEPFDPKAHGHFDLRKDDVGRWQVVALPDSNEWARLEVEAREQAVAQAPSLDSDHDARVWQLAAVALRRGQFRFRAQLLTAYDERCAISGCDVADVLEAAHILPFRGGHTDRIDNGLLLRSDLHTLFDCLMLWITPEYKVALAPSLAGTQYELWQGKELYLPKVAGACPNLAHIAEHAALCQRKIGMLAPQ